MAGSARTIGELVRATHLTVQAIRRKAAGLYLARSGAPAPATDAVARPRSGACARSARLAGWACRWPRSIAAGPALAPTLPAPGSGGRPGRRRRPPRHPGGDERVADPTRPTGDKRSPNRRGRSSRGRPPRRTGLDRPDRRDGGGKTHHAAGRGARGTRTGRAPARPRAPLHGRRPGDRRLARPHVRGRAAPALRPARPALERAHGIREARGRCPHGCRRGHRYGRLTGRTAEPLGRPAKPAPVALAVARRYSKIATSGAANNRKAMWLMPSPRPRYARRSGVHPDRMPRSRARRSWRRTRRASRRPGRMRTWPPW